MYQTFCTLPGLFVFLFLHLAECDHSAATILGCYYGYTEEPSSLTVEKVESSLCTHSFTFGGSLLANITFQPPTAHFVQQLLRLKRKNPQLKVLLSFNKQLSELVSSDQAILRFSKDVFRFLLESQLDGLDIDWEFPVISSNKPSDREGFSKLLNRLRKTFGHKKLLTIAVPAQYYIINYSYSVPDIAKSVDFINLMTYDFNFYRWDAPFTAHNSPFKPTLAESYMGVNNQLNMIGSALAWQSSGMPKEKIAVGIPLYGRTYTLAAAQDNQLFALATGPLPYSGYANQAEICKLLVTGGQRFFDSYANVPFCAKDLLWISYNDQQAAVLKADWIKRNGFAGAMLYDLNADDWNSTCSTNSSFPLTRSVHSALFS